MTRLLVLLLSLSASPLAAQTVITQSDDPVAVVAGGAAGTTYTFTCTSPSVGCLYRLTGPLVPKNGDNFTTNAGAILSGALLLPSTVGGGGWTLAAGAGGTVTDAFTRADGATLGTNWTETVGSSGWDIATNQATTRTLGGVGNVSVYTGPTWTAAADQYAQVTLRALGSGDTGPLCRASSSAVTFYYLSVRTALGSSGNHQIQKAVGGVFTTIANITSTFNAGDVARIECEGSTIRAFNGATLLASVTDTDIAAGNPGLYGWNTGHQVDDFQAGPMSGGATGLWSYPATARNASFTHTDPPGECDTVVTRPRCKYPEDLLINQVVKRPVVAQSCSGTCTVDVNASKALVGPGTWFYDYVNNMIYIGDDPTGALVELSYVSSAATSSATNVTVANLGIQQFAVLAQHGAVEAGGSGWVIHHNEIRWNHGRGVTLGANSWLHHNSIHHNYQMGVGGGGANLLVEDNTISDNRSAVIGISIGWEAGATKFVFTTNLLVQRNTVQRNDGIGLWTDISNRGCTIANNTVDDNTWAGIMHEISFACVIRDNILRRNGLLQPNVAIGGKKCFVPDAGIYIAASSNVEVSGNFLEGNADGICALQQDRSTDETVFSEASGAYRVRGMNIHDNYLAGNGPIHGVGVSADAFVTEVTNLTGTYAGASDPVEVRQPAGTGYNNRFECNHYYLGDGSSPLGWWLFTDYTAFANWQSLLGHDTGGVCLAGGSLGSYVPFANYSLWITPPAVVTLTQPTDTQSFSWDPNTLSADPTRYEWRLGLARAQLGAFTSVGLSTSAVLPALSLGTYTAEVRSCNASGCSDPPRPAGLIVVALAVDVPGPVRLRFVRQLP